MSTGITSCLSGTSLSITCTLEISTDPSGIWSISAKTSSGVSFRGFSVSWMPSLGLCAPPIVSLSGCQGNMWKEQKMKVNPMFLYLIVTIGHCCHSWHANTPAQKIWKYILSETLWVSSNRVVSSPHCTVIRILETTSILHISVSSRRVPFEVR